MKDKHIRTLFYGTSAAVVLLIWILTGAVSQHFAAFCPAPDKELPSVCAREWLGAFGGWAAIIVAVPSLMFLRRQISDTAMHHRQNAMLALRRKRSVCQQLINLERQYQDIYKGSEVKWINFREGRSITYAIDKSEALIEARVLKSLAEDPVIAEFYREVEMLPNSPRDLIDMVGRLQDYLDRQPETLVMPGLRTVGNRMAMAYSLIEKMHIQAADAAKQFLDDTSIMLNELTFAASNRD